ncbi:hypothetical protein JVU11DRAFT_12106 [Chiua virens]|nr:hypothetical protein JVU11DRAFT_12106 [Chiua virens]
MKGEKSLDRLCAIYELLAQANDKLCKRRHLKTILEFQRRIAARDEASGEYLWAKSEYSKAIIDDIIRIIERWMVVQTIKRDQSERPSGKINSRNRAIGPRLRNAEVVVPPQEQ